MPAAPRPGVRPRGPPTGGFAGWGPVVPERRTATFRSHAGTSHRSGKVTFPLMGAAGPVTGAPPALGEGGLDSL